MRRVYLIAALFAVAAGTVAATSILPTALRAVLAVPLVLLLPGWSLLAATGLATRLNRGLLAASTVGLSAGITVLLGVLLNTSSGGLGTRSWAASLAGAAVLGFAVAATRLSRRPNDAFHLSLRLPRPAAVSATVVAVALVAGAVFVAHRAAVEQQHNLSFVQLWVAPSEGGRDVDVGLRSFAPTPVRYRLELQTASGHVLQQWSAVTLGYGMSWERSAALPSGSGAAQLVVYRGASGRPYETVWTRPAGSASAG